MVDVFGEGNKDLNFTPCWRDANKGVNNKKVSTIKIRAYSRFSAPLSD